MKLSDEVLMAYADNELDESTRKDVESAMRNDPEIARRIEQHRALRKRLSSAFEPVLREQVPPHLVGLARNAPVASHAASQAKVIPLARKPVARRWLPPWAAVAASLLIGILAGHFAFQARTPGLLTTQHGQLVASGLLASALTTQLASQQHESDPVRIGISFRSKSDEYCRTFSMNAPAMAGLACRTTHGWDLQVLSGLDKPEAGTGAYREAASSMPAAVVGRVTAEIAGEPLDAAAEQAARNRGWQP